MKYTFEFLARVYGAYIFCNVNTPHGIDKLCSVYPLGFSGKQHGKYFYLNDLQLLLTPLSDISDEDEGNCLSIIRSYNGYNFVTNAKYVVENIISGIGNYPLQMGIRLSDYLRSRGYDCGYGEIPSLIEAGIAIKKQQP